MYAIVRFDEIVTVLREPRPFTIEGVNYPASFWYASAADKQRIGMWPIVQDARPDDGEAQIIGSTLEIGSGEVLEHWVTHTLTNDEKAAQLAAVKREAKAYIDAQAEEVRLRVVTPGAVQQIVYTQKAAEARDVLTNHTPQNPPPQGKYPMLEAEIGITGADIFEVATVVKGMADAWTYLAAQVEQARLAAKAAVDAATTPAQARAQTTVTWPTIPG